LRVVTPASSLITRISRTLWVLRGVQRLTPNRACLARSFRLSALSLNSLAIHERPVIHLLTRQLPRSCWCLPCAVMLVSTVCCREGHCPVTQQLPRSCWCLPGAVTQQLPRSCWCLPCAVVRVMLVSTVCCREGHWALTLTRNHTEHTMHLYTV
jgi:hypothetical protein